MTTAELIILKDALLILGRSEVNYYKSLPDTDVQPSKETYAKIKRIGEQRNSFFAKATKTLPRRVAVCFIAAAITLCLMMSVSAIRTPIVNFFSDVYDNFIHLFFTEEEEDVYIPAEIERQYAPAYLPNGFYPLDSFAFSDIAESYWERDVELIMLYQEIIEEEFWINFDNEHSGFEKLSTSGSTVYYYINKGERVCVWLYDGYLFTLILPDTIDTGEVVQIINSIK